MKIAAVLASLVLAGGCFAESLPPCVCINTDLGQRNIAGVSRLWGKSQKMWPNGETLRVKFLEGTDTQKKKVTKYFKQIDDLCGINFYFVESGDAECRITFRMTGLYAGNWSYMGKDCLSVPKNKPTLNISLSGWDFDSDWRDKTLHECLHFLGFGHTLQSPYLTFPWHVANVIEDYQRTQRWSVAMIRAQVLTRESDVGAWGYSGFDKDSIMCYEVSRRHVTDPAFVVKANTKLSPNDVLWLQKRYPQK